MIDAGFELEAKYEDVFKTDNHKSAEIIFTITFDSKNTLTWDGMTYLAHAKVSGSMPAGT